MNTSSTQKPVIDHAYDALYEHGVLHIDALVNAHAVFHAQVLAQSQHEEETRECDHQIVHLSAPSHLSKVRPPLLRMSKRT